MAAAREDHAALLLADGRVLIVGGSNKTAEIYDPSTRNWSGAGSLTQSRAGFSATLLKDGTVLVSGGSRADGGVLASSERWVPETTLAAPAALDFGEQTVGTAGVARTVTITNTGRSPLLIDAATAGGEFAVTDDRCTSAAVAPGAGCSVELQFGPFSSGPRQGTLRVRANTARREHDGVVGGTGVAAPAPLPRATPAPRAEPTPVPVAKRKPTVEIEFRSRYSPAGLSRAKACRGRVTLQLRRGKRVLARRATRLDRRCRYTTTFSFKRTRIGAARTLTVVARFHGNRYLGATTNRFKVDVPD
jgi:Abnormal spindle-like microcephaly-assoc'd, ASPM-SPD-2-Hydin